MEKKTLSELRAGDIFKIDADQKLAGVKLRAVGVYEVKVARRNRGESVEVWDLGRTRITSQGTWRGSLAEQAPMAFAKQLRVYKFRGPR